MSTSLASALLPPLASVGPPPLAPQLSSGASCAHAASSRASAERMLYGCSGGPPAAELPLQRR